ncbi:MAG: hypothetical protein Q3962_07870 [Corynebacterium sp.]|nr:hypothetical protein [Corynebacterium sp.]
MFNFGRRAQAKKADIHIAAEQTNLPLSQPMVLMMAQELPIMDSVDRARVYEILRDYDGPLISSQAELPEEIRKIMDLD